MPKINGNITEAPAAHVHGTSLKIINNYHNRELPVDKEDIATAELNKLNKTKSVTSFLKYFKKKILSLSKGKLQLTASWFKSC